MSKLRPRPSVDEYNLAASLWKIFARYGISMIRNTEGLWEIVLHDPGNDIYIHARGKTKEKAIRDAWRTWREVIQEVNSQED